MPAYVFKGKTRSGAATSGERNADSKDAVIAMLRREQILVTSVKEKGKEFALPKFGGGIKPKDVAIFTRQFSVMIDAGLPLVQCLEILGTQNDNPNFQKVLLHVRQDVEGGSSLADAMKKHPKVFDDLFTNMIAAGEAGGIYLAGKDWEYLRPATPPVFSLKEFLASIDRLLAAEDLPICYAHFGRAGRSHPMLKRQRAQLLFWESVMREELAEGEDRLTERCMGRLLREDPELKDFGAMPAADQEREKFFTASSLKGYWGFLQENPQS